MTRRSQKAESGSQESDVASLPSELRPWLAEEGDAALDLSSLRAELERDLDAERGLWAWLRARSTPTRFGLIAMAAVLLASGTLLGAARPDLAVYPRTRMVAAVVVLGLVFLANAILALYPVHRPQPARWLRGSIIALAPTSLLALYLLPRAHAEHPASQHGAGLAELVGRAAPCLLIGVALVAAMAALFRAFERQPTPAWLVSAAGGGVAANLVLQLHCPVTEPGHLLLGHFGVLVLALVAAIVLRARRR